MRVLARDETGLVVLALLALALLCLERVFPLLRG
jgi:hypothetical protein